MREYELLFTWPAETPRPADELVAGRFKSAGFEPFADGFALGKIVVRRMKEGFSVASPFDVKAEDAKKAFELALEVGADLKLAAFDPQLGRPLSRAEGAAAADQFERDQAYAVEYGGAPAPDGMVFSADEGSGKGWKLVGLIALGVIVAAVVLPRCTGYLVQSGLSR